MVTIKNTANREAVLLRNSAEAYTIHLTGEPYVLTSEMLQEQAETNIPGKRKWDGPLLEFISYENNTLKFKVSRCRQNEFMIGIHISPDKLEVSCSCGMQVEKLCIHALKALKKLIWHEGETYFEKYKPDGELETGLKQPKFFEKKTYKEGPDFTPKKNLGSVYHFSYKISPSPFAGILDLPEPSDRSLPGLSPCRERRFLRVSPALLPARNQPAALPKIQPIHPVRALT